MVLNNVTTILYFLEEKKRKIDELHSKYNSTKSVDEKNDIIKTIHSTEDDFRKTLSNNGLVRVKSDFSHEERISYRNVKIGDKFRAHKTTMTMDDFGFSGLTFKTECIIADKIYEVDALHYIDFTMLPYITDETGCLHVVYVDEFERLYE